MQKVFFLSFFWILVSHTGYMNSAYLNTITAVQDAYADDESQQGQSAVLNNLGNTYLINAGKDINKLDSAIVFYQKAMELAPTDVGIKLNLGIAYLLKNDPVMADSLFGMGFAQCGNNREKVYSLLGMDYNKPKVEKGAVPNITETHLREQLEKNCSRASTDKSKKKIKAPEDNTKEEKNKKKKKLVRQAGDKSLDPEEMKDYLYWKL